MPLSANHDHHLVQMPVVARRRAFLSQVARDLAAEFQIPPPGRLVRNVETSFCQQVFNVAIAQSKTSVEPDRVIDNFRWKSMALEGYVLHPKILAWRGA